MKSIPVQNVFCPSNERQKMNQAQEFLNVCPVANTHREPVFPGTVCVCSVMSDSLWPHGLYPLSIGISRQEYWIGFPIHPPGDLPDSGIGTHVSFVSCIGKKILYHWTAWEAWYST